MRHYSGIVDHHVNAPEFLHGGINEFFHLVVVGDIGGDRECLAALGVQLIGQRLNAVNPPRTEHNACTFCGEKPRCGLAQPAACAGDHYDFSFDVFHV
jgi:hypothetical protein